MPFIPASTLRPPFALRAAFMAAAVIGGLLLTVPALSSDLPSRSDVEADTRLAPPLVPTTAAATPVVDTSRCAAILRGDAPVGGRAVPAHYQHNLMPMAIIGMMTGVNHVTGPRERAAAFAPSDAAAALDGRNARAIAAYRQCRAEATLRALSN
jgi:hypothetical protein